MNETLDLKEAATLLHCHQDTLRKLAADGKVPAAKVGRAWVFSRAHILAWPEELMNQNLVRGAKEKPPSG